MSPDTAPTAPDAAASPETTPPDTPTDTPNGGSRSAQPEHAGDAPAPLRRSDLGACLIGCFLPDDTGVAHEPLKVTNLDNRAPGRSLFSALMGCQTINEVRVLMVLLREATSAGAVKLSHAEINHWLSRYGHSLSGPALSETLHRLCDRGWLLLDQEDAGRPATRVRVHPALIGVPLTEYVGEQVGVPLPPGALMPRAWSNWGHAGFVARGIDPEPARPHTPADHIDRPHDDADHLDEVA